MSVTLVQMDLNDLKEIVAEVKIDTVQQIMLDREQVLAHYNIKYKTLYNLIKDGYVNKYGLGTLVRFDKREIDASFKLIKT